MFIPSPSSVRRRSVPAPIFPGDTLVNVVRLSVKNLAYRTYLRRLELEVQGGPFPHHVGVILDGNRRWARAMGYTDSAEGHRRGAGKIDELLSWCVEFDIPIVTLWLLSTENLSREPEEVGALLEIIEDKVRDLAADNDWKIRALGALDLLPDSTREVVESAQEVSAAHTVRILNVAVGYGGRQEISDAMRRMMESYAEEGIELDEAAKKVSPDEIARFLYTAGLPDPDLIIRTSGEVRLSGFLLWQSAHSEFYFCDPYWPDFRKIDFLRAVRSYQLRARRFGK
jgi:short-chain Z-isoprenyl diphosphate synthase